MIGRMMSKVLFEYFLTKIGRLSISSGLDPRLPKNYFWMSPTRTETSRGTFYMSRDLCQVYIQFIKNEGPASKNIPDLGDLQRENPKRLPDLDVTHESGNLTRYKLHATLVSRVGDS